MIRFTLFLVDIKLLDLNSKAKNFRDSFICEKSYSPPFRVGEKLFIYGLKSEPEHPFG